MQFITLSVLFLSSVAVALPAATEGKSVTLPEGVVRITSVLSANSSESCQPLECSCVEQATSATVCVVPLGGDKLKCGNVCTGINRQNN
ncbi:hypothetical protein PG996_009747 [Apiospora saccharicola]|uniref:Uncharacterized protein n=1 Tax=Apiospora saccharicola TaxID=335842 RepID=A0ABR1ULN5_9PEZI